MSDKLNLATYASAQGEGISGVLVVEGKRGAVGYNPTHPLVRRRYTIAHEIGHYVMHVKSSAQQSLFVDRYVAFRDDQSSEGKDWQEVTKSCRPKGDLGSMAGLDHLQLLPHRAHAEARA